MAEEDSAKDTSTWEEVRIAYELTDGGIVEVTDATPVPLGDDGEYTFKQLTYRRGGTRIVFEVADGVPGCTEITLSAQDRPVRAKDLAAIKLDRIRDEAFRTVGVMVPVPGDFRDAPQRLVRKAVSTATSRRKIDNKFLRDVADAYESAEGNRVEAVMDALGAGERQAFRYIRTAREKGFIK